MRPSIRFALCLLLLAPTLFGWVKQGTVSGNITDVEVIEWDGAAGLIFVATSGAGVFRTQNGIDWVEANGNGADALPDYTVKAIASFPGKVDWLLAVCSHGVYFTKNMGDTWANINDNLAEGTPPENKFPAPFQDIAVGFDGAQYRIYLATLGASVFYRYGTDSPFSTWMLFNDGDLMSNGDNVILSIAANGNRALAGTATHLYWLDLAASGSYIPGWWYTVADPGFPQSGSIPALSFRFSEYALASVGQLTGGGYGGVWYAQWTATPPVFAQLNPLRGMPTDQPFLALDYYYDSGDGTFRAAGGTPEGLWFIPKPGAAANYTRFPFKGGVTGVGVGNPESCDLFFGGPGKGPFWANLCNTAQRPEARRNQMADIQVADIAVSPGGGDDHSVFGASRIAGLYKNQEAIDPLNLPAPLRGYFTRMAGDPEQENAPDVLCLAISPAYQEGGTVEGGQLTLFAGTSSKGVLRTMDGGRSWAYVNTGLPADAKITALAISPKYGQVGYPLALFAAVYGQGVYATKNNGATWTPAGTLAPIANLYINALAIHPDYPTPYGPSLYAGCQADLSLGTPSFFTYTEDLDEWMAGSPGWTITSLTVGIFSEATHIYAGTASQGVWFYDDLNGWQPLNTNMPADATIRDIAASPKYSTEPLVMAAVRPTGSGDEGGVYFLRFSGLGSPWIQFIDGLPIIPFRYTENHDTRVLSVAFDPNFATTGAVFCGHVNRGIFSAKLSFSGPLSDWTGSEGFFTTPKRVNGVAVDPADPDLVFAATDDMGVFVSFDGGFTFRPWSVELRYGSAGSRRPVPKILSIAIAQMPGSASRRAICGTAGQGIYFNEYDPSVLGALVSPWNPPSTGPAAGNVNEIRIATQTVFSEDFASGIPASWTVINSNLSTWTWRTDDPCNRRNGTPPSRIDPPLVHPFAIVDSDCEGYGILQDEQLITPPLLSSVDGINSLLLKFDHSFVYTGDLEEKAEVDIYLPSSGMWVNLLDTATLRADPSPVAIDLTSYIEAGIQIRFHYQGEWEFWWAVDNVRLIANYSEDIRASVIDAVGTTTGGDWYSNDYGTNWAMVSSFGGAGLADMSFMDSSPIVPGRGMGAFIWGCSSGKQVSTRGVSGGGKAWKYTPYGGWTACSVPSPTAYATYAYEDFRAILKLRSGPLLLGSKDLDTTGNWIGLWRSENTCSSWAPSVEGLPTNPQVYALQELSGGDILAGLNGTSGGVFLSDSSSGGRAWVRYSAGFSTGASGTVELTATETSIYTGMSADGIYADSTALTYTGPPTAYFKCAAEACVNAGVSFQDYSAGRVVTRDWNFGDGSAHASGTSVSHAYASAGSYTPALTVCNHISGDCSVHPENMDFYNDWILRIYPNNPEVPQTMTAGKTATLGEISLSWDGVYGTNEYLIWVSTNPAVPPADYLDKTDGITTHYEFSPTEAFLCFRVQPVPGNTLCGTGVIGGTW